MNKYGFKKNNSIELEVREKQIAAIDSEKIEKFNRDADFLYKFLTVNNILRSEKLNTNSLELGCGLGAFTFRIASSGYSIVGTDISQDIIDFNNKRGEELGMLNLFRVVDINQLSSFQDCSFDYVFIISALHHIKNIDHIFNDMFRVLKTNGRVIIVECNTSNLLRLASSVVMKIDIEIFRNKLHLAPHLNEGFHFIGTYRKLISKFGSFSMYPYPLQPTPLLDKNKKLIKGFHYKVYEKLLALLGFSQKYRSAEVCIVGEKLT